MSDSRRDFLKKLALVTGGLGFNPLLSDSIQKAMGIAPDPGTTFYDAEHVVLLMQENRSFDHCFGSLKGVRGFNDPRAISLPGAFPVWLQPDKDGNRFLPFRLDIKNTKITWMGGVPHSWEDQVDARNEGRYDGWIEAKRPRKKEYRDFPMTMGYYNRNDIPFYYALADAFTVCDQHFCAALTGTTTNRNYFWTGKTHDKPTDKAKVRNGEMGYDNEVAWTTFPERLEEGGISWRVYQNEVSLETDVEDSSFLANFTDNNLEWFKQFAVRFSPGHYAFLLKKEKQLVQEIDQLNKVDSESSREELEKQLETKKKELAELRAYMNDWSPEKFEELAERNKKLHQKAFTTNIGDRDYHKVEAMLYDDQGEERETNIPKGDILHQFRKDVKEGKLPTVSWVVAPQKFSDHPSAPWYGAWYVSELMDILTQNPEVWKKTIFILNYDENDGYFDHVPPFVPPHPHHEDSGKVSNGLDFTGEFVSREEELKAGFPEQEARTSPVGLGYRVPLIIASPWSRGGYVNSEICDITSTIQFLEKFLSKKTGSILKEPNISSWRRTISGDLTSAFRPYNGETINFPKWLEKDRFVQEIYNSKFKAFPSSVEALSDQEAREIAAKVRKFDKMPQQESGTKPSNALKYELYTDGRVSEDGTKFIIRFEAAQNFFGKEALGAPFNVYAPGNYWNRETNRFESVQTWAFAVKSGDAFEYEWPIEAFQNDQYHLRVYGPNGYFREFKGNTKMAGVVVRCSAEKTRKDVDNKLWVTVENQSNSQERSLVLIEEIYQSQRSEFVLKPGEKQRFKIDTEKSKGWYDFKIKDTKHESFDINYAGRLETGKQSISDPYMGQEL